MQLFQKPVAVQRPQLVPSKSQSNMVFWENTVHASHMLSVWHMVRVWHHLLSGIVVPGIKGASVFKSQTVTANSGCHQS